MKSTIRNSFFIAAMFCSGASQATLWYVTDVLSGTDGGFGYSSLHKANDSSPMTGSTIATVNSASGTYDDATNQIMLTLGLSNNDTMSIAGFLDFDGSGALIGNSTVKYTGLTDLANTYNTETGMTAANFLGFLPGDVCCSGSYDPNSFLSAGVGDLHYMTLWGADFTGDVFAGSYNGSTVGMDMRLELSAVPIPAAVWLFGTALIGLVGFGKRRKAD